MKLNLHAGTNRIILIKPYTFAPSYRVCILIKLISNLKINSYMKIIDQEGD